MTTRDGGMRDLFDPPPPGHRGGTTFSHALDYVRLNQQATDVWKVMRDGRWHTLHGLSAATRHPEASISARLRDFRKERFGAGTHQRGPVALPAGAESECGDQPGECCGMRFVAARSALAQNTKRPRCGTSGAPVTVTRHRVVRELGVGIGRTPFSSASRAAQERCA